MGYTDDADAPTDVFDLRALEALLAADGQNPVRLRRESAPQVPRRPYLRETQHVPLTTRAERDEYSAAAQTAMFRLACLVLLADKNAARALRSTDLFATTYLEDAINGRTPLMQGGNTTPFWLPDSVWNAAHPRTQVLVSAAARYARAVDNSVRDRYLTD